jgi:SAM-dependent MidA family methyltransferase
MDLCLHDPDFGYYATRPRLGAQGDFITAPHVSQMVGELLGLWTCDVFSALGRPKVVRLVEFGPGDGVMMTDVLRTTTSAAPEFIEACKIVLVETSPPLMEMQAKSMREAGHEVSWIEAIEDIPSDAPVIALANEFLDCLPVRQALRTETGWRERVVGLDGAGRLAFTLSPNEAPRDADLPASAPPGAVAEWSPELHAFGAAVGGLLARSSGAALFLDYGSAEEEGLADTLQALLGHCREDPLARPGEADLTAHVRFAPFLSAARAAGAKTPPTLAQAEFLRALGIEERAAILARSRPDRAEQIGRQLRRLVAADQMGLLFRAACIHSEGLAPAPFAAAK